MEKNVSKAGVKIDIQKARIILTETTLQELVQAVIKRRTEHSGALIAKVVSPKSDIIFMIELGTRGQESLGYDLLSASTDTADKRNPGTDRSSVSDVPTR